MQPHRRAMLAVAVFALLLATCAANTARTCYSCEGVNCMRISRSSTQQCEDVMDYCVTIFDNFNVVRQGCSMEMPVELRSRCNGNNPACHKCNTDRCNNMGHAHFMCLQCESTQDANCAMNPAAIASTRCARPSAPNSYCYVQYAANNATQRGCATTVVDQQRCYADGNCMLCLPGDIAGCNVVDFVRGTRRMSL